MEEQDNKIKERFQKDKLMSKKADDLFMIGHLLFISYEVAITS